VIDWATPEKKFLAALLLPLAFDVTGATSRCALLQTMNSDEIESMYEKHLEKKLKSHGDNSAFKRHGTSWS